MNVVTRTILVRYVWVEEFTDTIFVLITMIKPVVIHLNKGSSQTDICLELVSEPFNSFLFRAAVPVLFFLSVVANTAATAMP